MCCCLRECGGGQVEYDSVSDRLIAWERLQQLISDQEADQLLMATVSLEDIASVCSAKIGGKAPGRFLVSTAREM